MWLARHQSANGSWRGRGVAASCGESHCPVPEGDHDDFDTGLTALGVLAFLRAGHAPDSTNKLTDPLSNTSFEPSQVVTRALTWLAEQQAPGGSFAPDSYSFVYDEALAELAMVEAFVIAKARAGRTARSAGRRRSCVRSA